MHRIGWRRAALALMVGFSASAVAVDHDVSVFLSDHDGPGTACDHGALARIDLALQTNPDGSGQVTASSVSTCEDGGSSFGAPQALPDNVGPIAMRTAPDGFHPVEFALPSPLGELPDGATLRIVVEVGTADDFIEFGAIPNTKGDPILFVVPAGGDVPPPTAVEPPINIPVTGTAMLAALLLGIVLVVTLGKRYRRMLPVLLLGASAGLMAQVGGFRFDWSDGPLIDGDSSQPDAYIGVGALFVRADRTPDLQFAFRIDMGLQSEPVTLAVSGSPLLLQVGGAPGELTLTNTSTVVSTGDLWVELPSEWFDVGQDSSDCAFLAPGASCRIVFTPGTSVHASETLPLRAGNTLPVDVTIEVQAAPVPVLTATGSPLQLIANGPPGSIVVTNLAASLHAATNIRATLPPGWDDVAQDASDCASLAPGASCTLLFTPGAIVHPAEAIVIAGDDTQTVTVSIEVTAPVPTLLSVTPDNGNTLGGTEVVLTGANLEGATAVIIGSWEATISSVTGTQIEAVTAPSPSHGTFDVTVVTPAGNAVLQGGFSYTIPLYRLGGVVNGLTGTLVLTNLMNGDVLAVSEDGPFTMPTRLQAGFGYDVVVATQPAGQACSVVNGQSFINGVDSDNVMVDCGPAPTYTVGGEVGGLVGEVVLAINGGETVTLDAAVGAPPQPFAFTTALPSGSSYEVLVQSQSAWLACTVSNGNGTIESANVTDVSVTCELPGAALFSLSPASGSTLGGSTITANGEGFTGATALMIDGIAAAGFSVIDDTQIEATLPPHAAGVVEVYVASPLVSDSNPLPFTYVVPDTFTVGGTLAGLASGETVVLQNNGGDDLPLSGNGPFVFPTPVVDGGSYAVSVLTQPTGTTCTVVDGSGTITAAPVDDVLVTCAQNPPVLDELSPASGSTSGGQLVTVTGSGLSGAMGIAFGSAVVSSFSVVDDTTLHVITPAHVAGSIDVVVQHPAGNSNALAFTYVENTFNIGGILSGLAAGESLTLANNGGDHLTIPSDGPFTFATPVVDGGSYDVTVLTQPEGQTCTVTNGNGTVPGATVSHVMVVCSVNTYTIGGLLSGLAVGQSLTLSNKGGYPLVMAFDGSFTFATPVVDGGSYNVTVLAQPLGQICTVANGSGTVAGSNVTNVMVVCAENTYTIGGTVSGLDAGGSLTLSNNGGDHLVMASDGSFTFATPVVDGGSYNVTVLTQPAGQTCTVVNGSGTVSASNITNVMVVCTTNTYTIGGTISGLMSSAMVLTNNGADLLAVQAGATSFTFPTPVAHGSPYQVDIAAMPPGLACTISNDTGIADSNVTNVQVNCVAPAPTISNIEPNSGPTMGGMPVVITGTNFIGVTGVTFGGIAANSVNVVDDSTITLVTPSVAQVGIVDVVVQGVHVPATASNGFTYVPTGIGQSGSGGLVACLNGGLNDLVVATTNPPAAAAWSPVMNYLGTTSATDGAANTELLVTLYGTQAAAERCASHEVDSQGNAPCQPGNTCYDDWFLPATAQMACIKDNRNSLGLSGAGWMLTSTEATQYEARTVSFSSGIISTSMKTTLNAVRCARSVTL